MAGDDAAIEVIKYVNAEMYKMILGAAQRFQHQMKPQGFALAAAYAVASYAAFAETPREEAVRIFRIGFDAGVKFKKGKG